MSSHLGQLFRIATWGESHGPGVGVVIDGCPPLIPLAEEDIQRDLDRRRPGQSEIVTPRKEEDACQILSGVFEGRTTGTPISILVWNKDARPEAYTEMQTAYRPSHADYTYDAKYGIRDHRGGGRASARETIGRVAAAAVAKKVLERFAPGLEIVAYVKSIRDLSAEIDPAAVTLDAVESNIVRCPDAAMAERMIALIKEVRSQGDSVGGTIECVARNVPAGLGEPVFDRLEADLAKADAQPPRHQGLRDRQRLRRHPTHRLPAQRRIPDARRRRAHRHQPLRRHPGRHLQRRADLLPRRLQAHRHDRQATAHRDPRARAHRACRAADATTHASSRAPSPWSKP